MNDLVVRGGEVLTPEGRVTADVVVEAGMVSDGPRPERVDVPTLDATGLVVAPGFVDLQCNGAVGIDLTAEPERLWEVAAVLPQWGVTAWLPTIVTSPETIRRRAIDALADPPAGELGARPLGLHLEGPFLSPDRRGAHNPSHLRLPDLPTVDWWSADAGVSLVTLAPELPGALEVVAALVERGVVVSLGHSTATAAQARAAIDRGAAWVTHLFNAMEPLHHREPGLLGVALTDARLRVGMIVDGIHVDATVVRLAAELLGERLTLVTDAAAALGAPPGPLRLGDVELVVDEVSVRTPEGSLAGSKLSLDRAVSNLMQFAEVGLEDAVFAATTAPAGLLGLDHAFGVLAPGAVGDLVLLDVTDGGVEVVATVIGGEIAYDRRNPA